MLTALLQTTSSPSTPTRHAVCILGAFFLLALAVTMLVLGVALIALRMRTHRKRLSIAAGLSPDPVVHRHASKVDPWTEAGRRMTIPPRPALGEADTVDLDPEDLGPGDIGPEDIEPPETPYDGSNGLSPDQASRLLRDHRARPGRRHRPWKPKPQRTAQVAGSTHDPAPGS